MEAIPPRTGGSPQATTSCSTSLCVCVRWRARKHTQTCTKGLFAAQPQSVRGYCPYSQAKPRMSPGWPECGRKDSPVMLSAAKHLAADPSLWGGVTIGGISQTLRCAQGDSGRYLGLMSIGADKSAVIGINLSKSPSTSVGAREVGSGWEGLYGRPLCFPVQVGGLLPILFTNDSLRHAFTRPVT